jgi:hypothetical protein
MDNPSASLGRTLGSGIFSLEFSSNFPNVQFLNASESLDKPQVPNSTDMKHLSASGTSIRTDERKFL